MMRAGQLCHRVTCIRATASLSEGIELLLNSPHRALIVVSRAMIPIGLLSERSVLRNVLEVGIGVERLLVKDATEPLCPTVDVETPIEEAARHIRESLSRFALVMDGQRVMGLLGADEVEAALERVERADEALLTEYFFGLSMVARWGV